MIVCHLRVLLARLNVERAKTGRPPLGLRQLATETGVSLSVLSALHAGRSRRVDYATLDRLMVYFHAALPIGIGDLLVWEPSPDVAA